MDEKIKGFFQNEIANRTMRLCRIRAIFQSICCAAVCLLLAGKLSATTAQGQAAAGEISNLFIKNNIALHGQKVGYLKYGGTEVIPVELKKDHNYIFVVGGCHDAYHLGMGLVDPATDTLLVKDVDNKNVVAMVKYTPNETKPYTLLIQMANSTRNGAHYAVLMGETEAAKEQEMKLGKIDLDTKILNSEGNPETLASVFESTGAKALYIRLWATWCPPCIAMLPNLEARFHTLPSNGIAVISVNAEQFEQGGNIALAKVTLKKHDISAPAYALPPNSPIVSQFGIDSIPRSLVITKDGQVIFNGHPIDKRLNQVMQDLGVSSFDLKAGLK